MQSLCKLLMGRFDLSKPVMTCFIKHAPDSDSGRFGIYPAGLQVWDKKQVHLYDAVFSVYYIL